jgi:branched-chain amino acid transport system substrate-binding protein
VVKANGGTVAARAPPAERVDFSSFLLQAQSKAQILGLANAGGDTINAIKAAKEFGINKTMKMAGLLVFINDIHSLGLKNTEGLQLADSWYWNQDDARASSPSASSTRQAHALRCRPADYSATMTYLKAVKAAGTTDADKVMAADEEDQDQRLLRQGGLDPRRRPHDARHVPVAGQGPKVDHALGLLQDGAKVPGEQAFTTVAESKCSLLKK